MKFQLKPKLKQIINKLESKSSNQISDSNEEEDIVFLLKNINYKLKKLTSIKYNFFRAIINGIGTTIGATIIAGLLIIYLNKAIKSIQDIPFLKNIINTSKIEQVINERIRQSEE